VKEINKVIEVSAASRCCVQLGTLLIPLLSTLFAAEPEVMGT
jgi:hypothetical protein